MWKTLTVLCGLAFVCASGDDLSADEVAFYTKQTNDVFDQLLDSVSRSQQLDPFQLPEVVSGFDRKILIRFHGEARIYNGTLTGLSTIHRTGDSHFKLDESRMEVLADVGLGALDVACKAHVKFMGKGPTVNIAVHIAYARVLLEAVQEKDGVMTLKQFKLQQLDGFKLRVTGLGPLSYLFNYFVRVFTKLFRNKVKDIVESRLAKEIGKRLKNFQIELY